MPDVMRAGSILLLTVAALGAALWLVLENDGDVSETYTPTPRPTVSESTGGEIDPGAAETAPGTGRRPSEPDVILLTGVVKDREGKPLANARVQVLRDERRVARTRSRTDGRFILEGPAGLLPLVHAGADDHASRTFRDLPVGS